MRWRSLILVIFIGGGLSWLSVEIFNGKIPLVDQVIKPLPVQLNEQKLYTIAESITVKILAKKEVLGSGFIVDKQGTLYTVLTNDHVLVAGDPPYQIQTPDGRIYAANIPKSVSFEGKDLALLQFRSLDNNYAVASLSVSPKVGDQVFASGFPVINNSPQKRGLVLHAGKVSLILDQPLAGGYKIGYTNLIEKGMSGGPLLNIYGQVVSINGMHAEPLWGDPYIYENGSQPEPNLKEQMSRYSWGVPIEIYLQLAPKLLAFLLVKSRFT